MKRGFHWLGILCPFWISLIVLVLLATAAVAQSGGPMSIQWQKVYGGGLNDSGTYIRPSGSNYVLVGTSEGGGGVQDTWISKLDGDGNYVWGGGHGGNSFEFARGLVTKPDGSAYVISDSGSYASGDKTSPNPGTWLIKMNANGSKLWDLDVRGFTYSASIADSPGDGVLVGFSVPGADFTSFGPWGVVRGKYLDAVATKLDSAGNTVWYFSGHLAFTNRVMSLSETRDGGAIIGGNARVFENQWRYDYFLMKLDSQGVYQWGKTYGGMSNENLRVVRETSDGGFLLVGESDSPPGNAKNSPAYGGSDCWVVKVDAQGTKLWDKTFGGSGSEQIFDLVPLADGGFIAAGFSDSTNGTRTATNFGGWDGWILRCDVSGNQLWEQNLGGNDLDNIVSLSQTADGGFIVGLETLSGVSGNKTVPSNGFADYWLVKLAPEPPLLLWERCCSTNAFSSLSLVLQGTSNVTYRIESSADLTAWTAIQTNRLSGPRLELLREGLPNGPRAFYRASVLP